jgi:hypothetical protein
MRFSKRACWRILTFYVVASVAFLHKLAYICIHLAELNL